MAAESSGLAAYLAAARASADHAVLEGFHPLKHALRFGARIERIALSDPTRLETLARALAPDLLRRLDELAPVVVPAAELASLASGRSHGAPDVVAVALRPAANADAILRDPGPAPIVLLEEPTHLGNLGAVVRVAAAAGAGAVLTTGPHDPWHPAALRGSAGLHFALQVTRLEDVARVLDCGRPLVAADPEGDAALAALPARAVLLLGSERRGLSAGLRERATVRVRIPMRAGVSSLNLATAAAILLYAGR